MGIKNEAALYRAWKNGAVHTTLNPKGPGAAIIYISVDEEAAGQAAATRIFTSRIKKEKLNRLNKVFTLVCRLLNCKPAGGVFFAGGSQCCIFAFLWYDNT